MASRLTRDQAEAQARREAAARWANTATRPKRRADAAVEVWEHIGGQNPAGRLVPSGRFLTRPAGKAPPRWGVWRKVATHEP